MHNFKELLIWQKSMELASNVFDLILNFPDEHKFGLASQIQRPSISIPSNIAEGSGRGSNKEFIRFLHIANGSCCELGTQLILARHLQLIDNKSLQNLAFKISEIQKMNYALRSKLAESFG